MSGILGSVGPVFYFFVRLIAVSQFCYVYIRCFCCWLLSFLTVVLSIGACWLANVLYIFVGYRDVAKMKSCPKVAKNVHSAFLLSYIFINIQNSQLVNRQITSKSAQLPAC